MKRKWPRAVDPAAFILNVVYHQTVKFDLVQTLEQFTGDPLGFVSCGAGFGGRGANQIDALSWVWIFCCKVSGMAFISLRSV